MYLESIGTSCDTTTEPRDYIHIQGLPDKLFTFQE